MTRLGLAPEQCLVIEDSPRGLIAAGAAGIRCWVIPSGLTQGMNFERILRSIDERGTLLATENRTAPPPPLASRGENNPAG